MVFVIKTIYLQVEDLTNLMAFIVEVKIITLISDIPQVIGKQNLSSDVNDVAINTCIRSMANIPI